MKHYFMKQTLLQKGNTYQVTWLPQKFAVVGKYLKLKEGEKWSDGWQVKSASGQPQPQWIIEQRGRFYKDLDSIKNTTNLK